MEKRGVSIFVFTIMFTLIAGAIILVFFFSFGKNLLSFSGNVTSAENLLVLEKNLASFALATNSEKTIEFSDNSNKIDITCDIGKMELKSGTKAMKTNKLIFTPFQLKGKSVQAWTLAWNYPFKIDNLYFVADPQTKFYFFNVDSNQINQYFYNKFPKRFSYQKVTSIPSSLSFEEKAVLISFDQQPSDSLPNNVKTVQFIGLGGGNPKVKFKQGDKLPIWGDAMVYAAIFSADYDQFNCIINGLAKQRISNIVEIYRDNLERLKKAEGCNSFYNFEQQLNILSTTQSIDSAKNIKTANEAIKTTNCPVLYKGTETTRLII